MIYADYNATAPIRPEARAAMLAALAELPEGSATLPFVKLFYGQASRYLWNNDAGETHEALQAEGGE
ncbi:MAG: aminotransferase, partial [Pseudomonadota bacterium]|nr:aminotransferase [Pseudomonadota bacterium]